MQLNPVPPPLPHLPFISTKEEFKDVAIKEGFIRKRKLSDYHSESSTNTRKESLNESFNGLNLNNNNSGCSSLGNESNISIPKPIRPNKLPIPSMNPINFNNEQGKVIERLFDFKLNDINAFEKYRKIQQEGSSPQKMVEEPLPTSNPNIKNIAPSTLNNNLITSIPGQSTLNIPMCYFPFGMPVGKTSFTDLLQKNFEDLKQLQNTNIQFLGPLTLEERAAKVNKYLEKKKNRKWKYVRYSVRKDLADQRQRVQGRFVKTNKKLFFPMNASFEENLGSFSDMGNSGGSV